MRLRTWSEALFYDDDKSPLPLLREVLCFHLFNCGEGYRNIWPYIVSSFEFSPASLEFTANLLVM